MNPTNTAWNSESEKAHGENWRSWLGHLKGQPAQGLELGTWMGESAEWMLENIFTARDSTYCCVDTFEGSEEHRLAGIDCSGLERMTRNRLARFALRAMIFKARTDYALKYMFRDDRFDFIYVDAAHDAMNVLRDSVLAFELLKTGGTILWDDFTWGAMPEELDRPKMAIEAFLGCYARQLEVIGMGYQVAARRVA